MNLFNIFFVLWIVTVAGVAYYLFFKDIVSVLVDDVLAVSSAIKLYGWRLNRHDKNKK